MNYILYFNIVSFLMVLTLIKMMARNGFFFLQMWFLIICLCLFFCVAHRDRVPHPTANWDFIPWNSAKCLDRTGHRLVIELIEDAKEMSPCHNLFIRQVFRAIRLLSHFNSASTRFKLNFNINYRDKTVAINIGYGVDTLVCLLLIFFFHFVFYLFSLFFHLIES